MSPERMLHRFTDGPLIGSFSRVDPDGSGLTVPQIDVGVDHARDTGQFFSKGHGANLRCRRRHDR